MRVEQVGNATLYLGDCREVLPAIPDADALVTDPPYGIAGLWGKSWNSRNGRSRLTSAEAAEWDHEPAYMALEMALQKTLWYMVWGGNYYVLPPARCWMIWDKKQRFSGAEAEMAWTNLDKPVRVFRMSRAEAFCNTETKVHPTQKPTGLMRWCVEHLPSETRTILDPFMGSGTTGVAAVQMGKCFIGIEKDPQHFETACRRIAEAQAQGDLLAA